MLRTVCSNTSVLIGTRFGGPVVPLVRMWMPASLSVGSTAGAVELATRGKQFDAGVRPTTTRSLRYRLRRAASMTDADQSSRSATTAASCNASTSAAIDRADW